jgi:hypothetical protein
VPTHNAKVVNKVMEGNLDTEATGHRDKLSTVKTTLAINITWHPEQTTLTNTASTAKSWDMLNKNAKKD